MHFKRVIPCLDVDAGRVVKGTRFVEIRDAGDPVELAAHYDAGGADELVFLDITRTHEKRETMGPPAGGRRPDATPWPGRGRAPSGARGRSCSPAWTATAPATATTSSSPRPWAGRWTSR